MDCPPDWAGENAQARQERLHHDAQRNEPGDGDIQELRPSGNHALRERPVLLGSIGRFPSLFSSFRGCLRPMKLHRSGSWKSACQVRLLGHGHEHRCQHQQPYVGQQRLPGGKDTWNREHTIGHIGPGMEHHRDKDTLVRPGHQPAEEDVKRRRLNDKPDKPEDARWMLCHEDILGRSWQQKQWEGESSPAEFFLKGPAVLPLSVLDNSDFSPNRLTVTINSPSTYADYREIRCNIISIPYLFILRLNLLNHFQVI